MVKKQVVKKSKDTKSEAKLENKSDVKSDVRLESSHKFSRSELNFHEHISKFFANPIEFFEKTKSETFFGSVKYFGLFFLLIVLSNVFFGKPSDIGWVLYLGVLFGSLVLVYTLIPFLLNVSAKLSGIKTRFPKLLSMYFYVTSYFLVISIVLRVILSALQVVIKGNLYFNFFVSAFSVYMLVLLFTAFVYYTTVGLKTYFDSEGKRAYFTQMIFFSFLFVLVLVASFVFIRVISSGYQA